MKGGTVLKGLNDVKCIEGVEGCGVYWRGWGGWSVLKGLKGVECIEEVEGRGVY